MFLQRRRVVRFARRYGMLPPATTRTPHWARTGPASPPHLRRGVRRGTSSPKASGAAKGGVFVAVCGTDEAVASHACRCSARRPRYLGRAPTGPPPPLQSCRSDRTRVEALDFNAQSLLAAKGLGEVTRSANKVGSQAPRFLSSSPGLLGSSRELF